MLNQHQSQINLEIQSPIPKAMRSRNDLNGVWEKLDLVPYRGTTKRGSDRYLRLLYELFEHSTSYGAVVNDLITYGFDGEFDLVKAGKAGIKSSATVLSDEDKGLYCDELERIGLTPLQIIEISKGFVKHRKISGNSFLLYRKVRVNDEVRTTLELLHPMSMKYKNDDSGRVVYSENFFIDDWSLWSTGNKDFKEYRVFPDVRRTETITETVFHFKTGDDLYGYPETIQTVFWQYVEYALGLLSSKVTSNEFVASHLLEVPQVGLDQVSSDEEIKKYLKDLKKAMVELLTSKGINPTAMGVIMNPSDKDFKLHKLDVNRDTDWFNSQEEVAKRKIYEMNKSYPQLTGSSDAKSSLGQDTLTALFLMYDTKTVKPEQRLIANQWQVIMNFISEDCSIDIFKDVKFVFAENINEYVDKLNTIKNGSQGETSI